MDAYFECFAGISGNMILGALFDLGLDIKKWQKELDKLGISEEFTINIENLSRQGIDGTYVNVEVIRDNEKSIRQNNKLQTEDNKHNHQEHTRHLDDINELLYKSELDAKIVEKSKDVFRKLAEAEARVHGISPKKVHFHEVGAVDAIVDIVGAIIGLELLNIERIIASPLHTGTGFVNCSHGCIPVPAPATLELLKDIPHYSEGIESELTTPTGAAIITMLADYFSNRPPMILKKIGYGAGTRKLNIPNFLRINTGVFTRNSSGTEEGDSSKKAKNMDTIVKISANIDDMNPEYYQYIMESIFDAGALDVYILPVYMKKNRPGNILNVLCDEKDMEQISSIILEESTSLGVRIEKSIERRTLKREIKEVKTKWGRVRMKTVYSKGELKNIAPEYEDCRDLAEKNGVPLKRIYNSALLQFKNNY